MFRKILFTGLISVLLISVFFVSSFAIFSELDSISTTGSGISSDADTKTFFYNAEYGNDQESSYTLEYFTNQKVRINQNFLMYFYIKDLDHDSRYLFLHYLNNDLKFLNFDGEVDCSADFVTSSINFNKTNMDGTLYPNVYFPGGNSETCTLIQANVSLTYISNMGMLNYSESFGNVQVPLSRTANSFYLQPIMSDMIWGNNIVFYYKPLSTGIFPINPTPAPSGIWLSGWFSSSLHSAFYYYHNRDVGSLSASCGANAVVNDESFNVYDKVSTFDLSVEKNYLFNIKSSEYYISFSQLWFYPFIDNYYFSNVLIPGSTNLPSGNVYWNALPFSFNYIYSVRDPGVVASVPYPGDSDFNIENLYIKPQEWYDVPSYLNNFIIWFTFESPGISFITKPIGQIVLVTSDVYSTYVLGLISSLGIIGTFILFKFFYKFIIKVFVR